MMTSRSLYVLAVVGLALVPSITTAADVISVPTSGSIEVPLHEEVGFDWSGFYAGVFAGLQTGSLSGTQPTIGVQAGVNAQFDFLLIGAEVSVRGLPTDSVKVGSAASGQILGRAGLIVDDNALVYAASGYGLDLGAPEDDQFLVGGGVELAVTDTVTVEAEYLHGFPLDGGDQTDQITFGANFHF